MCILSGDRKAFLRDLVRRQALVRIANPVNGTAWAGRIISYHADPGIVLEQDSRPGLKESARRICLPESFTVTELARDWTTDAEGFVNSSEKFREIVSDVAGLIGVTVTMLTLTGSAATPDEVAAEAAWQIVAKLAHKYHLAPQEQSHG